MENTIKNSINNNISAPRTTIAVKDGNIFRKLLERDISENTKKAIESDLKHFLKFYLEVNREIFCFDRFLQRDIIDYKNYCMKTKSYSVQTINRRLTHIRLLCKTAVEAGVVKENPSKGVKLLKKQLLAPKGLNKQELRKVLKEVELINKIRDRLIIEMFVGAGFRVSELVKLRIDDINVSDKKGTANIHFGKGDKTREVPLNLKIRKLLPEYIEKTKEKRKLCTKHGELFLGERGVLKNIAFNKIIEFYSKRVSLKFSPHTLRHTFAYNYLRDNPADIVGLAQILGHSNINTTAIYTQNRIEDLQEKVENVVY